MSVQAAEEERLSLAYRELSDLPRGVAEEYGSKVKELDLSHNHFSDLRFLQDFVALSTLILDNNMLKSHVKLPHIPGLETLWVNHNTISNLSVFVETVAKCCPNLNYLSMMNNEAAPSYFNGGTYQQYKDYRCYVISSLPNLVVLDDHKITAEEREEARKIYGNRRFSVRSKKSKHGKEKRRASKS